MHLTRPKLSCAGVGASSTISTTSSALFRLSEEEVCSAFVRQGNWISRINLVRAVSVPFAVP